jgi:glyoxylase-like metal-dependent hydrolase (beta-lactamase superfamily II)
MGWVGQSAMKCLNNRNMRIVTTLMLSWTAASVYAEGAALRFAYIPVSASHGAQEAMVVKSGSWLRQRNLSHGAILIEHPQGTLLYDTGLGREVDQQYEENSAWAKALFGYTQVTPVADQFEAQGFDYRQLKAIIPSHLHWDHASGLVDFPGVPVWTQPEELEAAKKGRPPAYLRSQIDDPRINWVKLTLDLKPFLGFSRSKDIFGDGRVVLVDLAGHTRGQTGLYLSLSSGQNYLFIGDATWTQKGIEDNMPRPGFVQWLVGVDADPEGALNQVAALHKLQQQYPRLTIVPAHDEFTAARLPHYPEFAE